jgi:anti-sigma factor (TIGR02949 family)
MTRLDCNDVLHRLWVFLDGEADEAEGQQLREHIARCLQCRHHADFEVRLRRLIQSKCRTDRAPQQLREELRRLLDKSI